MHVQRKDLPDGSIGVRWSAELKVSGAGKPIGKAPLEMHHIQVGDKNFIADVNVYPSCLKAQFEGWLNFVYVPQFMPEYFLRKPEWKGNALAAASAADNACLALSGRPANIEASLRRKLVAVGGFAPIGALPRVAKAI